jgi:DtxR family Mn-dependent transcriptional regulator
MERQAEEILEALWQLEEDGRVESRRYFKKVVEPDSVEPLFDVLRADDLVTFGDDGAVQLTEKGRGAAEPIVRRHRLAECLLTHVLDNPPEVAEETACRFEHVLSTEVADSICTLLGHPEQCPHGRRIPRGDCCETATRDIEPLVMPLPELAPGEEGKVAYVQSRRHARVDKLSALGVVPGVVVRLHQKFPSLVIQIDETTLALDREIAETIHVRRMNGEGPKPTPKKRRRWGWRRRG